MATRPKRFTSKTQGLNAQVFVAKAINITTDATLALFLANAPLGEIGVYDGSGALHTDAITSTEEFFFIIRTTQGIKRSNTYKFSQILSKSKKAYVAPVKQISGLGFDGTSGSLHAEPIEKDQTYALKIIETTEGFEPYPTWSYEYTTVPDDEQIDVMQALAKVMNDDNALENKLNSRILTVKVKANATYGNYAATTGSTFTLVATNGSVELTYGGTTPTYDVTAGDYISFDAAATPTDSVGDVYRIDAVSATGFTLNRPYQGATQTFTEAEAEGTRVKKVTVIEDNAVGLYMTTLEDHITFRIAKQEYLVDADVNYRTAMTLGSGLWWQVQDLEREGRTFAGETTQNAERSYKYGEQDSFVVADETYQYYLIEVLKYANGIAPEAQHGEKSTIIVAVAQSAGNVDSTLDTLFAL